MRWDCHNCTLCCRLFALGPVSPEIVANLEEKDIAGSWAPAADGWVRETEQGHFLEHRDGSCVFLGDDGLCAIHVLHGPEAKPAFCRTFPFTVVDQPTGRSHAVRDDCGGAWRSMDGGTPVAEHIAALPVDAPTLSFGHDPVLVLPGVGVSPEDWQALEDALVDQVRGDRDPRQNVADLVTTLHRSLRREPLEPSPQRGVAALQSLVDGFAQAIGGPESGSGAAQRLVRQVQDGLARATAQLSDPPDLEEDARRYLAQVLVQQLRGKSFSTQGGVCWGLGASLLGTELARAQARDGSLSAIAPFHVRWSRFCRNNAARSLLHQARDVLWELALHLR